MGRRTSRRTLTDAETKRIQEELAYCATDFRYFSNRWLRIPADRGVIPFAWNPAQHKLYRTLAHSRRLMVLKIRQLSGISTGIAGRNVHAVLFSPGEHVLVVAQTDKAAERLGSIYRSLWESLPDWMRAQWRIVKPQDGRASDRETVFSWGNGMPTSGWQVHTAGSESIRSASGITRQHLSEVAFWEDAARTMAAASQTSITVTNPEIVLESTANGPNWYYETWQHTDEKRGGYRKLFLTWLGNPMCVSAPAVAETEWDKEIQANPAPGHPPLTPEQLGWVVQTRDTNCARQTAKFDQEYPTTWQRAFVLSGRPFFETPYSEAYGYVDRGVDDGEWRNPAHPKPVDGRTYVIGADPASGAPFPADGAAAVVLDATDARHMVVVCTVNVREPQEAFADRIVALAREWNRAIVVPERALGLTLVDALQKAKGVRIYREPVFDDATKGWTNILGWNTTAQSRPLMLARLHTAITTGQVDPGDIRLKAQLNSFRHGRARAEAAPGCKDDLVFALALAVMGLQQVVAVRQEARRKRPRTYAEQLDLELKTGRDYDPNHPAFGGTGIPPIVPVGFHGY